MRPAPTNNALLDCAVATAQMPEAVAASTAWMSRNEPPNSQKSRRLLARHNSAIAQACGVNLVGPDGYRMVHTRGAAESATHIIVTAVRAYATATKRMPHIVVCGPETSGPARCARALEAAQSAVVTIVPLTPTGAVDIDAFGQALRVNTCVATVVAVDPATGTRADIAKVLAVAGEVPVFVDAALLVGRGSLDMVGVAAFSITPSAFGGPGGCSVLALRSKLVCGYSLKAHVFGNAASVVDGALQGSTPNGSLIAASTTAMQEVSRDSRRKLKTLKELHVYTKNALTASFGGVAWASDNKRGTVGVIVFTLRNHARSGPEEQRRLAELGIYVGAVPTPRARDCQLRIALWHGASKKDIDRAVHALTS